MMRELVAFAGERGVRILPEFDSPAHFGTLAGAYPQFTATTASGGACMVDPSREETFAFLAAVWGDIAAMFPDAQFRIGGDEVQGCWAQCPAVQAWIQATFGANGTVGDAYHYYVRRVIGIQRALHRSTMAWLDVEGFPDKAKGETWAKDYQDVTLNVWTGCYQGSWQADVARLTQEGGAVVVSGPFYITTSAAPHFTWQQMYAVDLANFTGGNSTSALELVAGGEVCVWDDAAGSDSGDLSLVVTPYIFGAAEAWWSARSATSGRAPDEMRAHFQRCRMGQRGWASHPFYAFGTFCPREYESAAYATAAGGGAQAVAPALS
jgi:hexosaminidase